MKRVLSTGDIASLPTGDDSIDNGGPFTQQKGRRKKQRKANTVTITNSITNDTDAVQPTQPTQSTQCITAPASSEFSLMHNQIDELLRTVRLQQKTIKVLSEKLNFVLSFLDAPGGLALLGSIRCAVQGSTDTVNSPKSSASSLVESQRAPDQPHPAQPTSYSSAVNVQAGQTRRQPSNFREIVTEAISAEQRASERRAKSVIVTGLTVSADINDKMSFKRLCMKELGIEPQITFTRRLGGTRAACGHCWSGCSLSMTFRVY